MLVERLDWDEPDGPQLAWAVFVGRPAHVASGGVYASLPAFPGVTDDGAPQRQLDLLRRVVRELDRVPAYSAVLGVDKGGSMGGATNDPLYIICTT